MRKMRTSLGIKVRQSKFTFPSDKYVSSFEPSHLPTKIITDSATFDMLVLALNKSGIGIDEWYYDTYNEFKEHLLNKVEKIKLNKRRSTQVSLGRIVMYKRIPNTKTLVCLSLKSNHFMNSRESEYGDLHLNMEHDKQVIIEFSKLETNMIEKVIFRSPEHELMDIIRSHKK